MKIVICGGTGFVGSTLAPHFLRQGHRVVSIGRRPPSPEALDPALSVLSADTTRNGPWQEHIRNADAVINLAGTSIFTRWTEAAKQAMIDSRILTTRAIVDALENRNTVLINTSAVGFYGNRGDEILDETQPAGHDFLADLASRWEAEAFRAEGKGHRVIVARFGVVLAKSGGAFEKMIAPFRFLVGGPLGNGKQWFSWIHIEDLIRAASWCIENQHIHGPVNFVSPGTVTNGELSRAIGRFLRKPCWLPAPAFGMKLILGEFASVLLASQRVIPKVLLENGFSFIYPTWESALKSLLQPEPQRAAAI